MSDFKSITGLNYVKEYLRKALELKRISHAYIFSADEGCGKHTMAKAFAKALLCEQRNNEDEEQFSFVQTAPSTDACNMCASCKQVESGNHPDLIWVTHEKPNTVSIDDIREQVNNTVAIRPYKASYKIYVIPDAELMTPQAQNAILKTIEEPPEYAVIILLTSNETELLATIHSRCVMLRFRPIAQNQVKNYLMQQFQLPDYKAEMCAAFGQGNLGKTVRMATDEQYRFLKEEAIDMAKICRSLKVTDLLDAVKAFADHKDHITDYLEFLTLWYRDILVYKATKTADEVIFKDEEHGLRTLSERLTYEGLEQVLEAIEVAKQRLESNVNFELTMELLLCTMKRVS